MGGGGVLFEMRNVFESEFDEFDGVFGGVVDVGDDFLEELELVALVGFPAVVVGGECDEGVGDFGFACEFGFGHGGHTDEVTTPLSMDVGFGDGGESGAFHGDVSSFGVGFDIGEVLGGVDEPVSRDGAEGLGEFDVDGGMFVEGVGSFVCFVDDLVGDDEVAWGDVFS